MGVVREDTVHISYVVDTSGMQGLFEELETLHSQEGVLEEIGDGLSRIAKEAAKARVEIAALKGELVGGLSEVSQAAQGAAADVGSIGKDAGGTGWIDRIRGAMDAACMEAVRLKAGFMGFIRTASSAAVSKIGSGLSKGMAVAKSAVKGIGSAIKGTCSLAGILFKSLKSAVSVKFKSIVSGVGNLAKKAKAAALNLGKMALQNMGKVTQGVKGLAKGLGSVGKKVQAAAAGLLKLTGLDSALDEVKGAAASVFQGIGDNVKSLLQPSIQTATNAINAFGDEVNAVFADGWQTGDLEKLTGLFTGMVNKVAGTVRTELPAILSSLTPAVSSILSSLTALVSTVVPVLVEAAGQLLEALLTAIQQNMEGLSGAAVKIIAGFAQFILEAIPQIVPVGAQILMSIAQGLVDRMPELMPLAMQAIQTILTTGLGMLPQLVMMGVQLMSSFAAGLANMIPTLIPVAVQAIHSIVTGLLEALPDIIRSGIDLIIALASGLAEAVPALIAMIPEICGSIISALWSVDWLKVGIDLIGGVAKGLWNGIKGLFGVGKEAGKGAASGLSEGMSETAGNIAAACHEMTGIAEEGMRPDTALLSDYGVQSGSCYASGVETSLPVAIQSADDLKTGVLSEMEGIRDTSYMGTDAANNLVSGLNSGKEAVTGAAMDLGAEASAAAKTDVLVTVEADASGLEAFQDQAQSMIAVCQELAAQLPAIFQTAFQAAGRAVLEEMAAMQAGIISSINQILAQARRFAASLKSVMAGISLYRTGVNIMAGLNRGMASMRGVLMATAQGIARDVSATINRTLSIHSPSRVTEASGRYADLGLIKGMESLSGKVGRTAAGLGEAVAVRMDPVQSRYRPESSGRARRGSLRQTNHYSPSFNLTLNGASASDSNERKVKRWVREAMEEAVQGMGRTNPRLREV